MRIEVKKWLGGWQNFELFCSTLRSATLNAHVTGGRQCRDPLGAMKSSLQMYLKFGQRMMALRCEIVEALWARVTVHSYFPAACATYRHPPGQSIDQRRLATAYSQTSLSSIDLITQTVHQSGSSSTIRRNICDNPRFSFASSFRPLVFDISISMSLTHGYAT